MDARLGAHEHLATDQGAPVPGPLFVLPWMALTSCDDTVFSNGHGGGGADHGSVEAGGTDGGSTGS